MAAGCSTTSHPSTSSSTSSAPSKPPARCTCATRYDTPEASSSAPLRGIPHVWREGKAQLFDPIVLLGQSCKVADGFLLPATAMQRRPSDPRQQESRSAAVPAPIHLPPQLRVGCSEAGRDDPSDWSHGATAAPTYCWSNRSTLHHQRAHQYVARVKVTMDQASPRSGRHRVKPLMQVS